MSLYKCGTCGNELPLQCFHKDSNMPLGVKKHCKSCANKNKRERRYKIKYNDFTKDTIICMLCGKRFRSITNTHLARHDITMAEYKSMFNKSCFSKSLLKEQKKNREITINSKYTKEEQKFFYTRDTHELSIASKKWWDKQSDEYRKLFGKIIGEKVKEFHSSMSKDEKEKFNKIKLAKRKLTNIQKYGVEFAQRLDSVKQKTKKSKLNKYGNENFNNSEKARQTHLERFGTYSSFCPHFSISSQHLFKSIEENISQKCYYATNGKHKNNEFQVYCKNYNIIRYLDFYIPDRKKWIEFDEDYHLNEDQIYKDKNRVDQIVEVIKDIQLLRIKEKLFNNEPERILKICLDFINS